MNQTATELRAVLEAMPGPASPPVPPPARHQPAAPPPTYRSTVEETLARIAHLEILINELGTIIRAMPDVTPPRRTVTTPMQPAIASSVAATGMLQRERDWAFASIIALLFVSAAWWLYRRWHKASDNITPHALSHHPSLVDGINVAPPPQKTATVIPEAQDLPLPVHVTSESTSAPRPAASHVAQESPAVDIPLTYEAPSPGATELSSSVPRPATEQIVAAGNDQALELAEIMVSMGLTEGAAQTLVEQIQANPKRALLHWLKLLEIYQKSGMKDQFENSARELQTKFNIQATDWKTQRSAGKSATLEDYGRIMAKVQELWPKPECVEFLAGLLEDNRGGTRAGFPQPVAEEILLLLSVLQND